MDFSFVASSRYRERVLHSLAAKPQLPRQLAEDTGLRISHVSRSLRQLSDRGLVECLTPDSKAKGRLYAITPSGASLIVFSRNSSARFAAPSRGPVTLGFVPKLRGAFATRCIAWLRRTKGEPEVKKALSRWSVDPDQITEDTWLSMDAYDEFLELLENAFGDGSYDFVRELSSYAAPAISTIKEQILRVVSLERLADKAPEVWHKEWNYGRLEVKTGKRWALFFHYDWSPTPTMCALVQGTYEGILRVRGVKGTVTKTHCVRAGDGHCEWFVKW
ncbi:MAG: winged helix-turn-helix transcriptional regulator [Euryarchaeota archaeon]|nr:winged helix-turn-helix transcriptional regulator [Euryarchaeota archaeon]